VIVLQFSTFVAMIANNEFGSGTTSSTATGARLWRIEQYNYVNGELINVLNVPSGAPPHLISHMPYWTFPLLDARGEELELQQLCFAQHGADEEALLASWQDTLFAWFVRANVYSTQAKTCLVCV
jgi:hypothetical protein